MKRFLVLAAAVLLGACQPKPEPKPGAGLQRCEAGVSARACRCAFEAMPTQRWQVFADWAAEQKHPADAQVWGDPSLHKALVDAAQSPAEIEAAARELAFLKATCGEEKSQRASLD